MDCSVWKLEGTTAHFDDGRFRGRIDLLQPHLGLHALSFAGSAVDPACRVLGVDLSDVAADDLSLPETYARVDDLVATYRQTEARPFRLQTYWRRIEAAGAGAGGTVIELQLSINTSLLDTHPSVAVTTSVPGAVEHKTADGRYRVVAAGGVVYFEAVHPSDRRKRVGGETSRHADDTADAGTRRHVLFGDFLEKGVIVRARVRAAFLPAGATDDRFDALYEEFLNEPLPLTT